MDSPIGNIIELNEPNNVGNIIDLNESNPNLNNQSQSYTCYLCKSPYCDHRLCFTEQWISDCSPEKPTESKTIVKKQQNAENCQLSDITNLLSVNIRNNFDVFITHNCGYQKCYIRSADKECDSLYRKLLILVSKYSQNAKFLNVMPEVGNIVVAPYFGFYFRAKVLQTNDATATVQIRFIDFGNKITTHWNVLKHLDERLQNAKVFIEKIYLKDINEMPNDAVRQCNRYLKDLITNKQKLNIQYICDRSASTKHLMCELFIIDSGGETVNDNLNKFNYQRWHNISDIDKTLN